MSLVKYHIDKTNYTQVDQVMITSSQPAFQANWFQDGFWINRLRVKKGELLSDQKCPNFLILRKHFIDTFIYELA